MRLFRRLKSPILVALLAVAVQATLVLAHAHVHPHAPSAHPWSKSASLACRAIVPPDACRPAMPRHEHSDDCPLCWSLAASGTSVLPSPIILAMAESPRPLLPLQPSSQIRSAARAAHFQARAPPSI